jgi:hypothetical protein
MTDHELLEFVETRLIHDMLHGCTIDDHLGERKHDPGSWSVRFRADTISRLLDMAKTKEQKP